MARGTRRGSFPSLWEPRGAVACLHLLLPSHAGCILSGPTRALYSSEGAVQAVRSSASPVTAENRPGALGYGRQPGPPARARVDAVSGRKNIKLKTL